MLPVGAAGAFEIFGLSLFEDEADRDAEAVIADPQPYSASLEMLSPQASAETAVRNASNLLNNAEEPASGAAGLIATANGDYRRITAALYAEGFYGGAVNILIGGREAATLLPDTNLPDPVAVRILVEPGPQFRFGRLSILNPAPPTRDPFDEVDSPVSLGFAQGEVARSSLIGRAEQLAIEAWREQGFPKAEIARREVVADHATNMVDVVIEISPGQRAAFGEVSVSGTTHMDPIFVRQQTGLAVGEEYDPDAVELAERRLNRLGVFRAARLEAAESIGPGGLLPFELIVEEQPLQRFGVGATVSSVDGLGVEGFYLHRNLFGQAERLRLDARIAGIGYPIATEEFDYAFGGTFTKPGIFSPDTDMIAAISAERTVLPTFTEISAKGRVGLSHILSEQLLVDGSLFAARSRFLDDFGVRDFTLLGLQANLTFDNRDDPTDATEGFYLQGQLEPFYEFSYGNAAVRAVVEGRTYWSFAEDDRVVLAARARAGVLAGPDLSEIPPDRLFFAGGGGSVRGYGYKSIGVTGPNGIVTGGRYLLEGSLEARVKVTNEIGVVGFLDGGYVAADTFPGLEDLRLGAGVGLRYDTGFGPLRLDVAVPLNRRDNDPQYALYVGIGQSF